MEEGGGAARAAVLAVSEPGRRATLTSEAEPDLMAGEQTWPTFEEMDDEGGASGAAGGCKAKAKKTRIKGMSEYQASRCHVAATSVPRH